MALRRLPKQPPKQPKAAAVPSQQAQSHPSQISASQTLRSRDTHRTLHQISRPDGTVELKTEEHIQEQEEELSLSYQERFVAQEKQQTSSRLRQRYAETQEFLVKNPQVLRTQYAVLFATSEVYAAAILGTPNWFDFSAHLIPEQIIMSDLKYVECPTKGPISNLIRVMLLSGVPSHRLPRLSMIFHMGTETDTTGLVMTSWLLPFGLKYDVPQFLALNGVMVPLMALEWYAAVDPHIAAFVQEYVKEHVSAEEQDIDASLARGKKFSMAVLGRSSQDHDQDHDQDQDQEDTPNLKKTNKTKQPLSLWRRKPGTS